MTFLPARATLAESCDWLRAKTGEPWTLCRLLESGLMPWFWLDHTPEYPAIFGDKVEGYLAPLCFVGDTDRLAAGASDVVVTMTRTHDDILIKAGPPSWRISIDELRFKKGDVEALVTPTEKQPWTAQARTLADEYIKAWRAAGYDPSGEDAALYVEGVLSNRGQTGPRGKFLDRATIKKESLAGVTGRGRGAKSKLPKVPDGERGYLPKK